MKISKIKLKISLVAVLVFALLAGIAVQPGNLPQVVDDVRAVVGPAPVAFVENVYYGLVDQVNRVRFNGRTTPGFWAPASTQPVSGEAPGATEFPAAPVQAAVSPPSPPAAQSRVADSTANGPAAKAPGPFAPPALQPLYPALAAPGEGEWVALPDPSGSDQPPLMYKTFLHPDPQRPYARVAIVAIDLSRVRLHVLAGTFEPASTVPVTRTGLIPQADLPSLVAAFNGGFKAIHGHYGMMVAGKTILPPQPEAGTLAIYADGSLRIAPWSKLAGTEAQMQSFRQTPPCLALGGKIDPDLLTGLGKIWGAAVDGNTVIWRSAIGLSADGRTLYYAAGESLTARRLAEAMLAAGASDAVQLDVNLTNERFLTYAPASGSYKEQPLLSAMSFHPGVYVTWPAMRDFFYLTLASRLP